MPRTDLRVWRDGYERAVLQLEVKPAGQSLVARGEGVDTDTLKRQQLYRRACA